MIVKMRAQQFSSHGPRDGWRYVDHVDEAYNYGQLTEPDDRSVAIFNDTHELVAAVERMWGPLDVQEFWRVYWPEFDAAESMPMTSATCVRFDHGDGRVSLAILTGEAYLLGDDGKTVDRLR